jgi:hypothetical protein
MDDRQAKRVSRLRPDLRKLTPLVGVERRLIDHDTFDPGRNRSAFPVNRLRVFDWTTLSHWRSPIARHGVDDYEG